MPPKRGVGSSNLLGDAIFLFKTFGKLDLPFFYNHFIKQMFDFKKFLGYNIIGE